MRLAKNVFLMLLFVFFVGGIATLLNTRRCSNRESFGVYDHPSKCYACEDWKDGWQGMKTKSFSAERHAAAMGDPFLGKTSRYYTT